MQMEKKKCNMDCFNCIYDDCINDYVAPRRELTEKEKKYRSQYQLNRYYELKKKGLCTKCGKRPPLPGVTRCLECRNKHRRSNIEFRNKTKTIEKNREYRREHGLCFYCGEKVMEGKTICEKCYLRERELAKKMNEHPNTVEYRKSEKRRRFR